MLNSMYKTILHHLYDGVYFLDLDHHITYWNKGAERISGYTETEVLGKCCSDNILRHVDYKGNCLCTGMCPLKQTLIDGELREADVFLHHKSGHRVPVRIRVSPVHNEQGQIIGGIEIFTDNSRERQLQEEMEDLKSRAFIDPLTQMGNRRFGEMVIKRLLRDQKETSRPFALLFADVDHFKSVNDTHGHQVGDQVLKMVGKTISCTLRQKDSAVRWGGEEFVVLLSDVTAEAAAAISERIRAFIESTWLTAGTIDISATASIGTTLSLPDDTMESLVNRADRLMYQSKSSGRNRVSHDLYAV